MRRGGFLPSKGVCVDLLQNIFPVRLIVVQPGTVDGVNPARFLLDACLRSELVKNFLFRLRHIDG